MLKEYIQELVSEVLRAHQCAGREQAGHSREPELGEQDGNDNTKKGDDGEFVEKWHMTHRPHPSESAPYGNREEVPIVKFDMDKYSAAALKRSSRSLGGTDRRRPAIDIEPRIVVDGGKRGLTDPDLQRMCA